MRDQVLPLILLVSSLWLRPTLLQDSRTNKRQKSELDSCDEYGRFEEVDDSFSNTPTEITSTELTVYEYQSV
ncbi:hypothetical protein E3N88_27805 [Mikania micrantha]|uniref:Uncharacterized protein n=1 Tax=Mikania micrantha TaxID=192012 RepID=A0A5N6MZA1_9ASTR|nr:hypothetical protein E3N88_27805 [Mikania micrantha]